MSAFQGSGGFLGIGAHAAQPVFQENFAGAEWAAVTDQFFATIIAPLNAKATGIWGRSFEVSSEQNMVGIEGAMRMPGFQVQPGQTYTARFEIWTGPKIYHRLAQLEHNEAEIMNFGVFKIVSQFLLNFLNTIHGFVKELRRRHSRVDPCRTPRALAAPKQSESNNAQDSVAWAEDAGAARKIQRRSHTDEPGGDEAV